MNVDGENMDIIKIGKFIKELRSEKEMTQDELASKIGSTYKTISRWENGNYMPPIDMLMEISKIFSVSLNEILNGERIKEEEYKDVAENNLALLRKENELISLKKFFVCTFILVGLMCVIFAILFMISQNKAFMLVDLTMLIVLTGSSAVYSFFSSRFATGRNKRLYNVSLLCHILGMICALVAIIISITELW